MRKVGINRFNIRKIIRDFRDYFYLKIVGGFDEEFYSNTYPELKRYRFPLLFHYVRHGYKENRKPCKGFDPNLYTSIRKDFDQSQINPFIHYLRHGIKECPPFHTIKRPFNLNDVCELKKDRRSQDALILLRAISHQKEDRYKIDLLRAALESEVNGWLNSKSYWLQFDRCRRDGAYKNLKTAIPLKYKNNNKTFFEVIEADYRTNIENIENKKFCVYTSLYGDFDKLEDIPEHFSDKITYICFSDRKHDAKGWEYRVIQAESENHNIRAKKYKILPHQFLNEFTASLFVDATTEFLNDPYHLIKNYLAGNQWVMMKHPSRSCLLDEAVATISMEKAPIEIILDQVFTYEKTGYQAHGLCEASFIWRDHSARDVIDFMETWWGHIQRYSSQEELSLGYLFSSEKIKPKVLADEFGTSGFTYYFFKNQQNESSNKNKRILSANTPDIVFIYSEKYKHVGSTRMRSQVFIDILEQSERFGYKYHHSSSPDQNEKGIVLTKSGLFEITIDQIKYLKDNNLFVAADYVDGQCRPELHPYIDVYLASSIKSYIDYKRKFQDKHVFRLDHIVDPRLKSNTNKNLKIGYFGELYNAKFKDQLKNEIDFVPVYTFEKGYDDWFEFLTEYSVHYSVREEKPWDGYKPFLKGFTAAHCNAVLLTNRDESDAKYFLPPDYPYFVEKDLDSIKKAIENLQSNWGGEKHRYAKHCMNELKNASSNKMIRRQWYSFLNFMEDKM